MPGSSPGMTIWLDLDLNRQKEAEMLDIVVSGGIAVLPSGPEPADIGIAGERIAAIGAPGSLAGLGDARLIDATGQIVIPGGIDPHVHCNWPMPLPGRSDHQ